MTNISPSQIFMVFVISGRQFMAMKEIQDFFPDYIASQELVEKGVSEMVKNGFLLACSTFEYRINPRQMRQVLDTSTAICNIRYTA